MLLTTGIRCVERTPDTVFRTIESAQTAGLGESLYFFVDGDFSRLDELSKLGTVIHRTERSGAWPNFYLSLAEMYQRQPQAQLYALLEDDVVFCRELDSYLAEHHTRLEVASLFTSGKVEQGLVERGPGFHRLNPGWHINSGGQAWLMNNERLRQFLQSQFVVDYRREPPQNLDPKHYRLNGLYHTDSVVGKFSREAGCGIQYHYPSLAQHTGEESFMYPGFREKQSVRYSDHFPGEEASAMQLHSEATRQADNSPAHCLILVPYQAAIEPACEAGLRELESKGYPVWRSAEGDSLDQLRNRMATDALHQGYAETLWIDSHMEFDPADVEKLREHQLPICSALYGKPGRRELASQVLAGTETIQFGKQGGLLEILYAAAGFLHVRREAYETIKQQLSLPLCNEYLGKPQIPFFQPLVLQHEQRGDCYLSADYSFSERARQAGLSVYADTTIRLKQIGKYGYTWEEAGSSPQRFASYTYRLK